MKTSHIIIRLCDYAKTGLPCYSGYRCCLRCLLIEPRTNPILQWQESVILVLQPAKRIHQGQLLPPTPLPW